MSSAFGDPPESGVIGLASAAPEKIARPSSASTIEAEATRRIGCGEGVTGVRRSVHLERRDAVQAPAEVHSRALAVRPGRPARETRRRGRTRTPAAETGLAK